MTSQTACISADIPRCLQPTRQPLRRRALSTFARPVDDTALKPIYPPLPIYPLTPDVLGGKAIRGNISHLNPNPKPACFARAYFLLPRGTRSPSRVRACHGAFCVASPDAALEAFE